MLRKRDYLQDAEVTVQSELSTKLHLHVCLQRQSDCDFDVALPTREIITVLSHFILLCGTALSM